MQAIRLHNRSQLFFLAFAGAFVLSMMATAYLRSLGRKSIVTANVAFSNSSSFFDDLEAGADQGSRLQLQEFHRVEVKQGALVWEVKAKLATYYAEQRVTHVNDAAVTIYRSKDSSVSIKSRAAKLYMEEDSLRKAELEGAVKVSIDDSMHVLTEHAIYDSSAREITAPGMVQINGEGFEVKGTGLDMDIDSQIVKLSDDVYSQFQSQAKFPKHVDPSKQR